MATRINLSAGADLDGFRQAVRGLVAKDIEPRRVIWSSGGEPDLFGTASVEALPPVALPRAVASLIELVVCHRDPERYALLYTLVWRMRHGEPALLEVASDPLVHRLHLLHKAVRRDLHKMHAFLRFRRLPGEAERFAAWFEPEHFILDATAGFFVDRFRSLVWTIVTPIGSLSWDGTALSHGPAGTRADVPDGDVFESGWRGYYESVFNPARANESAMRAEMPKKYWRNMPEAALIPDLLSTAPARTRDMVARQAAEPIKRAPLKALAERVRPEPTSLAELNRQIVGMTPFVTGGTRAVLGEGPLRPRLAFVGEQPGDQEDQQGRPFVGPAGQLLDQALRETGIDRREAYLTNAVKHFKFAPRGKLRLHQKPNGAEVEHYRWWLERELELVQPDLVVALGATAVLALTGKAVSVTKMRGPARLGRQLGLVTVHPAYLLRLPDEAAKAAAWRDFAADLATARRIADDIRGERRLAG